MSRGNNYKSNFTNNYQFMKAIQVSSKNIGDIMRLPCVASCMKNYQTGACHYNLWNNFTAKDGDWIIDPDKKDSASVLTDAEYKKMKEALSL